MADLGDVGRDLAGDGAGALDDADDLVADGAPAVVDLLLEDVDALDEDCARVVYDLADKTSEHVRLGKTKGRAADIEGTLETDHAASAGIWRRGEGREPEGARHVLSQPATPWQNLRRHFGASRGLSGPTSPESGSGATYLRGGCGRRLGPIVDRGCSWPIPPPSPSPSLFPPPTPCLAAGEALQFCCLRARPSPPSPSTRRTMRASRTQPRSTSALRVPRARSHAIAVNHRTMADHLRKYEAL